jgi:uncharacterized protein (DUF1697 family)
MKTYIALIRGINVGSSKRVSMNELKGLLVKDGCVDVRTYIQSGNVVFRSRDEAVSLSKQLTAAVCRACGLEPMVMILTRDELERAAAANPYTDADTNPKSVHLFFLTERPVRPDLKSLEALRTTERFTLKGKVFYLHTPEGFGTSKLAQRVERFLGVAATARNWRTVRTLIDMAGSAD